MDTLFYLGLIFVLGAFTEWFCPKLHIPRVVGFLILGLIIGPEILGFIPYEFVQNSNIIIELSLSIIAVLIGATLKVSVLKGHAKEVTYITIFQSITTFIVVVSGFIVLDLFTLSNQQSILVALFLGSIATATAPAAPIAIVHELHARGDFTSTFLAVVAADDAISLIMFTLALTIGVTLVGSGAFEWMNILDAIVLIVLSSLVGIVAALCNTLLDKLLVHHKGMETIATLGLLFMAYSLSEFWGLEPLFSAMVMGIVMTNCSPDFDLVEREIDDHLVEVIFMVFFVLSAMYLNFSALSSLPFVIGAYVLLRLFGKIFGSYMGAVVSNSNDNIKKYLGFALMPQAGVAVGLALSLQKNPAFESIAPLILNIVISTTFIHELIGPIVTKWVIVKVGESKKELSKKGKSI